MIIVGYPAIGKSTIAGKVKCIDLESSNFKTGDDWYVHYCRIANILSEQGYTVFVSSHSDVVNELKKSTEQVFIIAPALELENEWVERLHKRYLDTGLDKDERAYLRCVEHFKEDINSLLDAGLYGLWITNLSYDLKAVIRELKIEAKKIKKHSQKTS